MQLGRRLGAQRRDRRPDAVLLRPLLRAATGDLLGPARQCRPRRALRLRGRPADRSTGSSSIPRSRAPPACTCSATSPPSALAAKFPRDPLSRRSTSAAARPCASCRATTTARRRSTPTRSTPRCAGSSRGREALHVVDLDGARAGQPVNLDHVRADLRGGRRSRSRSAAACARPAHVEAVLAAGAARAILGTAALADPALIEALAAEHGERIVVAADARAGRVAIEGWERESAIGVGRAGRELGRARRAPLRLHPGRGRRDARGARARRACRGRRPRPSGPAPSSIYSGGVGTLDHLRGARRAAGCRRSTA